MTVKIYSYQKCSTCQKALKFLDHAQIAYQVFPIREQPPTSAELKQALDYVQGDLKKLLNTSGEEYRRLNLKERLSSMSHEEVFELLSHNGMLVKRPFVLGENFILLGFKEDAWKAKLL
ncbi:arsenate reductase family protein [Parachlamydia sp. AcF125]|uniref:arsenate reductase family protein n=1 Tax=Parachlamydia sp. AcF125 TaxID=2795736 RepID=UPI001BCA4E6E|nr:arsenate reductase family protein [Parachlamydia sp. AcF125]MBS4169289.1 Regulatory protein Spx [Parachlamydia sp. AcF125]